jgi:hypothetical protein
LTGSGAALCMNILTFAYALDASGEHMSKTRKVATTVVATKSRGPTIPKPSEGSRAARAASCALSADTTAAMVVAKFSESCFGNVLTEVNVFTEVAGQLRDKVTAVHHGDLRDGEALLMTQAVGLNSIYSELVVLARNNLNDDFGAAERLMRLALKAQGQCRATLETLATVKNPPVIFARQANIAHGAQQINNGVPLARASNSESGPSQLLEAHGERLDRREAGTTGECDQAVATLGSRNRPADG